MEVLSKISQLDFSSKIKLSKDLDGVDLVSAGINMLSEELEDYIKKNKEITNSYAQLYNNSPQMLLSISPKDGSVLICNETLLNKTGFSKDEVIGQPVMNLYHQDSLVKFKKAFSSFQEKGEVNNVQLEIKKKDGSKIQVILNVKAQKDATGKVLYSNSSWTDISETVKLKHKIHEDLAQKLAGLNYHIQAIESSINKYDDNELKESFTFIKKHVLESIENSREIALNINHTT